VIFANMYIRDEKRRQTSSNQVACQQRSYLLFKRPHLPKLLRDMGKNLIVMLHGLEYWRSV